MWFKPKVSVSDQSPTVHVMLKPVCTKNIRGWCLMTSYNGTFTYLMFERDFLLFILINVHYKHLLNYVLKILIDSLVSSCVICALTVWTLASSRQ